MTDVLKRGADKRKEKATFEIIHAPIAADSGVCEQQRYALVESKRAGQELRRLSALDFAKAMREYGIFEDFSGKLFQKPECSTAKGFGIEGGLFWSVSMHRPRGEFQGLISAVKDWRCYRCLKCRDRVLATLANVYFPQTARGGYGPTHPVREVNEAVFLCAKSVGRAKQGCGWNDFTIRSNCARNILEVKDSQQGQQRRKIFSTSSEKRFRPSVVYREN